MRMSSAQTGHQHVLIHWLIKGTITPPQIVLCTGPCQQLRPLPCPTEARCARISLTPLHIDLDRGTFHTSLSDLLPLRLPHFASVQAPNLPTVCPANVPLWRA